tara:strand:- start:796 stop:915 length:120 start_codon:yes stop_codon:yes gene_type:complete
LGSKQKFGYADKTAVATGIKLEKMLSPNFEEVVLYGLDG